MCDTAGISTYTPYITAIGGVVAGGISSYFVGVKLSQKSHDKAIALLKRQEFNKAAAAFREAFVDAIFSLRNNAKYGKKRAGDIVMESVVVAHEKAKIMFESFVPADDLSSFNAAWEKYRYGERNRTEGQDNETIRKELSQIYLEHIDNILKFAEAKSGTQQAAQPAPCRLA